MANRTSLTLLLLLAATAAPAQWDDAEILTHPRAPEDRPFVLEVHGTWGNACNPSAAEPVITHFDGESLEIDFVVDECPPTLSVPYQYRVLVDISPAFTGNEPFSLDLDVTLRFGDEVLEDTILLSCALCDPPPPEQRVFPEPGLYQAFGHEKQGLLLARQDERLAVYPLVYDEAGASEWLFAGGGIDGNAYFAPLYQAIGGLCIVNCGPPQPTVPLPPPAPAPRLEPIGAVTMVFDSQGIVQMQIDDGPFVEYRQSNFGRVTRGEHLPDLVGTWAILDSQPRNPAEGTFPPATVLPAVFEIRFDELSGEGGVQPRAIFELRDLEDTVVGTLDCETEVLVPPPNSWQTLPLHCELATTADGDVAVRFDAALYSMDRLELQAIEPVPEGFWRPTGVLVRAEP